MSDTQDLPDRARASKPVPKPGIMDIHAYVPGKATAEGVANPIKLSANENILGVSPRAREAYAAAADLLHMYPDSRTTILRDAIASTFRLEPERLIFGCGSDEVFQLLNQAYLEPGDNIVQGEFGFAAYAIGAHACQARIRLAKEPGYRIDVDEILKVVDDRTRLIFLANPGNPTGSWIPFSEIERLHANHDLAAERLAALLDAERENTALRELLDAKSHEAGLYARRMEQAQRSRDEATREERAAVVAWLREAPALRHYADCIERGEHRREEEE